MILSISLDWRYFLLGPAVIALEMYARMLGLSDYRLWKRKHAVWEMVETTRRVVASPSSSGSSKKTPLPGLAEPT